MELTILERLQLANQYKILSFLDEDGRDHYLELEQIVRDGYAIFYSMLDETIDTPMPEDHSKLVLDILDFYRALQDYLRAHPTTPALVNHPWAHFAGFDGNHEGEYLGFTRFLIEVQEKWQEFKDQKDFNSHMPTVDKYAKMVAKWEEHEKNWHLSEAQFLAILEA